MQDCIYTSTTWCVTRLSDEECDWSSKGYSGEPTKLVAIHDIVCSA